MNRPDNKTLMLIGAGVVLLFVIILFAVTRDAEQDRIEGSATFSTDNPDLNRVCAGQVLYEQIKRALFRQAAQARVKDAENYERIAGVATVRMENPAAEGEEAQSGTIACAGSLAIDLPPGIATVAGRRQLMTDIYYSVEQAASGAKRVVQLRGADAIVGDLAGLTVGPMQPSPLPIPSEVPPVGAEAIEPLAPEPDPVAPPVSTARPSFDCSRTRTSGERAVCSDPTLAGLDRAMAADYTRAMASASPQQQALLRQTRNRLLAYRDNCPDTNCIGAAYNNCMREIADIMRGY